MRKKRIELQEDVIIAARNWAKRVRQHGPSGLLLAEAIQALDDHEAAELTGAGGRYAAGSDTSKAAAGLSVPLQFSVRQEITEALTRTNIGYTDDQLEERLKRPHQTVSSARNWLVAAGWVRDSGQRRKTRGGREAVVWELTDAGTTALQQKGTE